MQAQLIDNFASQVVRALKNDGNHTVVFSNPEDAQFVLPAITEKIWFNHTVDQIFYGDDVHFYIELTEDIDDFGF